MTVCCSPCYTSIIHCFNSLTIDITDPLLSNGALFSRFCSHMIQTWAVKVASYLAKWIVRSHTQYAIEIGSNCDFQVSQGSAATQLRWGKRPWESLKLVFRQAISIAWRWQTASKWSTFKLRSPRLFCKTGRAIACKIWTWRFRKMWADRQRVTQIADNGRRSNDVIGTHADDTIRYDITIYYRAHKGNELPD